LSPEYVRRSGPLYGFKPWHALAGVGIFVLWFGVLGFVLTHGRNEQSSVDVYSELPPGFTSALAAKGVTYEGLSSVDPTTQSQALAHLPATTPNSNGGQPLVFRTSFSSTTGSGRAITATPALMVVIADQTDSGVSVDFVNPTSFAELDSVRYGAPGDTSSPSSSASP
jgi:hypothetical protein